MFIKDFLLVIKDFCGVFAGFLAMPTKDFWQVFGTTI